jgi:hypothetical protein
MEGLTLGMPAAGQMLDRYGVLEPNVTDGMRVGVVFVARGVPVPLGPRSREAASVPAVPLRVLLVGMVAPKSTPTV